MSSVERQVRRLVRTWPIPDRVERGEEIVGTTLDLVPDGATRLPVALALDLVVGGLGARWRMRPPVFRWFLYRMGGRLPSRWHRWIFNDLTSPGWRRRIVVSRLLLGFCGWVLGILAAQISLHRFNGSQALFILIPLAGLVAATLTTFRSRARKDRDRQLVRHGYGQCSQDYPPWPPPPSQSQLGGPQTARLASLLPSSSVADGAPIGFGRRECG